MAAPMRIVFCFAFTFLLLQLQAVNCREEVVGESKYPFQKEKNTELPVEAGTSLQDELNSSIIIGPAVAGNPVQDERITSTQLAPATPQQDDVMQGLQFLDESEREITSAIKNQLQKQADILKPIPEKIEGAKRRTCVRNGLRRALRSARRSLRAERKSVANKVCYTVHQFRTFLKSAAPTDELASFTKQADFQSLLNGRNREERGNEFNALVNSPQVDRMLRITNKPSNKLNEWKTFAVTKIKTAADLYKSEMDKIEEQATKALHLMYNAMVVYKDAKVELKDGQKRPTEMKEKEDMIKNALKLHRELNC